MFNSITYLRFEDKGCLTHPKRMNFWKSSEGGEVGGGGGVIFNPKIYIADFGPLIGPFQHENDTKGSF